MAALSTLSYDPGYALLAAAEAQVARGMQDLRPQVTTFHLPAPLDLAVRAYNLLSYRRWA